MSEAISDTDLDVVATNERLREVSRLIYGDKAELRVVDPARVRLLSKNARFMRKPTFDQLTSNVARDKMLSSIPLCEETDGALEVVSGNHRIKAAVACGLNRVLVLVVPYVDHSTKVARQLSHNAITGEDDLQLLSQLWKELDSLQAKLYSGLDSDLVKQLEDLQFVGFTPEQIRTEQMTMWFLPEEVADIDALLEKCAAIGARKGVYMVPIAAYEYLWSALVKTKKLGNIKNTALAFIVLTELLKAHVDLDELIPQGEGEAAAGELLKQPE